MQTAERLARIAWGIMGDPGDARVAAWLDRDGVEASLELLRSRVSDTAVARTLTAQSGENDITPHQVKLWRGRSSVEREQTSDRIPRELGVSILTPGTRGWPRGMDDLGPYAPHTLWVRGNRELVGQGPDWLGVVGSRKASEPGLNATRQLVEQAVALSWGIVSGGASGIDRMAHQHALSLGASTIAVLAGGVDTLYPASNRGLLERIAATQALVAEAPCTVALAPERFLHRNRLIAALSKIVVVTEAWSRSGAMNTASHATALGRRVAVVPGRWGDPQTEGCFRIARERGALVLTEARDLSLLT